MLFRPLRAFGLSEQTPLLLDYHQIRLSSHAEHKTPAFGMRSIDDVQNLEL
jgi:hypothetical protein